jgi:glycerol-3-phosphate O-acyltransferase/dihydroxyacetone phosphate acyltransferase
VRFLPSSSLPTFLSTDPFFPRSNRAGIHYSDKTKYRSCAVMEFGPNISVEPYVEEFLVSPKAAVKKLTAKIAEEMKKVTVNAPDWFVLFPQSFLHLFLHISHLTSVLAFHLLAPCTDIFLNRESRNAATMARKILWPDDRKLPLNHLRKIDQTCVPRLFPLPAPLIPP